MRLAGTEKRKGQLRKIYVINTGLANESRLLGTQTGSCSLVHVVLFTLVKAAC